MTLRVVTVAGTGNPGYSETQANKPFGLTIEPDGGLYFCDIGTQRMRCLDRASGVMTTVAGNGETDYTGNGGPVVQAALSAAAYVARALEVAHNAVGAHDESAPAG